MHKKIHVFSKMKNTKKSKTIIKTKVKQATRQAGLAEVSSLLLQLRIERSRHADAAVFTTEPTLLPTTNLFTANKRKTLDQFGSRCWRGV